MAHGLPALSAILNLQRTVAARSEFRSKDFEDPQDIIDIRLFCTRRERRTIRRTRFNCPVKSLFISSVLRRLRGESR